jgi:hypothetical protein
LSDSDRISAEPFSPDAPEVRFIAQLAGIAPSRLAAFVNDPKHARQHMTPDEGKRLMDAFGRLKTVIDSINVAMDIAIGKGKH